MARKHKTGSVEEYAPGKHRVRTRIDGKLATIGSGMTKPAAERYADSISAYRSTPVPTDAELAITHTQLRLLTSGQFVARNVCLDGQHAEFCTPAAGARARAGGAQ